MKVWNHGYKSSRLRIEDIDVKNADVYMYSYNPNEDKPYKYEGLLDSWGNQDQYVHTPEDQALHLVVVPQDEDNSVTFYFKAIRNKRISAGGIVAIVFGSIFLAAF